MFKKKTKKNNTFTMHINTLYNGLHITECIIDLPYAGPFWWKCSNAWNPLFLCENEIKLSIIIHSNLPKTFINCVLSLWAVNIGNCDITLIWVYWKIKMCKQNTDIIYIMV